MDSQKTIRVLSVDNRYLVQQGLHSISIQYPQITIIGEVRSIQTALEVLPIRVPDVLITNDHGPEVFATIRKIVRISPRLHVIVLTDHATVFQAREALDAGALGYLSINEPIDAFAKAIFAVMHRRRYIDSSMKDLLLEHIEVPKLTRRELQVLCELAKRGTSLRIAEGLSISEKTVKTHLDNVRKKFAINNRTEALVYALRMGFIRLEEISFDE